VSRVVVDASVLSAIVFGEPAGTGWGRRLEGAAVYAPRLLQYELQSVAWKKCRQDPRQAPGILAALALALEPQQGITWGDPDPADVVLMATATGLTPYDASYLCLAGMLGADLLTGDRTLAAVLDPSDRGAGHSRPAKAPRSD
jgi:predicted nucleic acid-binding protein